MLLLTTSASGMAQATQPPPPCRPVVGVIEGDTVFRACALDQIPRLLTMTPLPPAPPEERTASAHLLLTVRPDGTIDAERSRPSFAVTAPSYDHQLSSIARHWRYEPGVRNGRPVSVQIRVAVHSDFRNDTLPASMEWRYVESAVTDTLRGTWIAAEPVAPLSPQRQEEVQRAVLRELVRQLALQPGTDVSYCLVLPDDDPDVTARHAGSLPEVGFAATGCAGSEGVRHIHLSRAHATEGHRVVVTAQGDHLAHWPPGFNGRAFPLWTARCVSVTPPDRPAAPRCAIRPLSDLNRVLGPQPPPAPPLPFHRGDRPRGDSLLVSLIAKTTGSFRNDTIQLVVPALPSLLRRSLQDTARPCGIPRAYAPPHADSLFLVHGILGSQMLEVLPVLAGTAPPAAAELPPCAAALPDSLPFITFLLGDLGAPATSPVTLCFVWCDRAYRLVPDQHTVVERAQIRIRIGDLSAGARDGGPLEFRLHLFPIPAHLVPYVAIRQEGRRPRMLRRLRLVTSGVWGDSFGEAMGYFPDTEVLIYLFAR